MIERNHEGKEFQEHLREKKSPFKPLSKSLTFDVCSLSTSLYASRFCFHVFQRLKLTVPLLLPPNCNY